MVYHMVTSVIEKIQQGQQYRELGVGGRIVVQGGLEMVLLRQRIEAGASTARWVFGKEHGLLQPPLAEQVASAKALRQEMPVDKEEESGIRSEQQKTHKG